jgi:hypothetical protein
VTNVAVTNVAETIENWNGQPASALRSPSGVLLADWADNVICPPHGAWPPAALVMKLGDAERPDRPLPPALAGPLSAKLGHRTALQSINSEDAITWSTFGPLMEAPAGTRAAFLNWLCSEFGLPWTDNTLASIDLWRRVPHPDKPRAAGGPELDAVLVGDHYVVFVEAKWGSGEGQGQGVSQTKGQIQLRREFLQHYGRRLWGEVGLLVLGVVRSEAIAPDSGPDAEGVAVRSVTWERLAAWPQHPCGGELAAYVGWRSEHSPE